MIHTPASFRALRETVGYTRAELARVLLVDERTVRRWESPTNPTDAPPGVWLWLEDARTRQLERIGIAYGIVLDCDPAPAYVELPYYVSQEHYEQTRRDEPAVPEEDCYTMANATNRELVTWLADTGIEARFVYPSSPREVSHGA